ncbi:MAG: 6-phosphofructokinase [Gemmataceae bacterium]
MKRIGILTAGGDTPALNATIHGAVTRASQRKIEVLGFIKGFSSLFNPRVPHVLLNPLYSPIPELDPTHGGTRLGASRDYVAANDTVSVKLITDRLHKLGVEGLICVGGDGTLNGMQALCNCLPTVLAPKTIDNDLGLNYRNEADEVVRQLEGGNIPTDPRWSSDMAQSQIRRPDHLELRHPGYAPPLFVFGVQVQRILLDAQESRITAASRSSRMADTRLHHAFGGRKASRRISSQERTPAETWTHCSAELARR